MSGLEILGAVLGSIPLVISALEHYANGITTAKRYMAYRRELMDLIDKIATEEQIFGNTVKQLLTGIVDLERMEEIVPGGDLWRDSGIDLELKNRLCDGYHIYLQNVRGMEAALQRIRKKLALDPLGKVRHGRSFLHAGFSSTKTTCTINKETVRVRRSSPYELYKKRAEELLMIPVGHWHEMRGLLTAIPATILGP